MVKKENRAISIALFFSIILHVIFIGNFLINLKSVDLKKTDYIEISLDDTHKSKVESVRKIKRQIVNNELSGKDERIANTRFVGEKNQRYDRQTIAKDIGIFKKAGLGEKSGKNRADKNSTKSIKLSDLSIVSKVDNADFVVAKESKKIDLKKLGTKMGIASESGVARNNDFIEDIPLGDFTNLNTQEFKFYGFYHRIRQRLEQFWGLSLKQKAERLYNSGRRIASSTNYMTSLLITLDDKGNIMNVLIKGTSGIRELDEAAVDSFKKAGPFPNPPKDMLTNGKAVIEWGFVVKS